MRRRAPWLKEARECLDTRSRGVATSLDGGGGKKPGTRARPLLSAAFMALRCSRKISARALDFPSSPAKLPKLVATLLDAALLMLSRTLAPGLLGKASEGPGAVGFLCCFPYRFGSDSVESTTLQFLGVFSSPRRRLGSPPQSSCRPSVAGWSLRP